MLGAFQPENWCSAVPQRRVVCASGVEETWRRTAHSGALFDGEASHFFGDLQKGLSIIEEILKNG